MRSASLILFIEDLGDRLTSETNASGATRSYTYDATGNRTGITDRNGKTRRFNYDPLNRLTTETWVGDGRTTTSTYDAAGQLTQINDADATYKYAFDPDGRLLSVNNAGTAGSPSVLMNYGYDAAGNMLSAADSINGTPAGTNTYTFDPLNRVTRMQQSGTGVTNKRVDYAYNAVGQPTNLKRFSDLAGTQPVAETTHTFDRLNRLSTINHSRGGVPLAAYNYGYDANSRITSVTNKDGTSTNTYDDTDQLTGVNYNGSQPNEAYTYDANGNRTNPGYVTGANNRLLSDGKFNYEYDGEGNVIKQTDILTGEITQYTWDYRNRLTNVKRNGVTVGDYAYDVYDQRIGKVTPTGTERFVYGQNQNIALEFDGSGALTNRYLHGDSIDAIIADEANGAVGWTLTDNLGTVRDVVDGTGASRNHFVYDSFGNLTSEANPSFDTRFTFTGREFDAETGNYDYRFRPLRPGNGRFIEEDPLGFSAGDPNLYRYVGNSPVDSIDPLGLVPKEAGMGGGGGLRVPIRPFPSGTNTVPGTTINEGIRGISGTVFPRRYIPDSNRGGTPQAFPTNIYGYRRGIGVFPKEDFYGSETMGSGVSKSLQTPIPLGEFDPVRALKPYDPKPNQCDYDGQCKPTNPKDPVQGGSYANVRNNNTGGQMNHIPSWGAIKDSGVTLGKLPVVTADFKTMKNPKVKNSQGYFIAPVICMTGKDHSVTESFARKPAPNNSRTYRTAQSYVISLGFFEAAQSMDIADVRGRFGFKYDLGIVQMVNYTKKLLGSHPQWFE